MIHFKLTIEVCLIFIMESSAGEGDLSLMTWVWVPETHTEGENWLLQVIL